MGGSGVTVVIPYHGERVRSGMLKRAVWSVNQQTVPVRIDTVHDHGGRGAWWARQRGLERCTTPWVAYLDSDDWMYPDHIETLLDAWRGGVDYLYSYFTVHGAWEDARPDLDPLRLFGHQFNPLVPTQTTGTILVRRELAMDIGGWRQPADDALIPGTNLRAGEDWDFTLRAVGGRGGIEHVSRRTWAWHIGHHNTSGLPHRGDAAPTWRKEPHAYRYRE